MKEVVCFHVAQNTVMVWWVYLNVTWVLTLLKTCSCIDFEMRLFQEMHECVCVCV